MDYLDLPVSAMTDRQALIRWMTSKGPVYETSSRTNTIKEAIDNLTRFYSNQALENKSWTASDAECWERCLFNDPFGTDGNDFMVSKLPGRERSSEPIVRHHYFEALAGLKKEPNVLPFSPVVTRYFAEGTVGGIPVEALPDSGASLCFISKSLVSRLNLQPKSDSQRSLYLANKKLVYSPGMVEVPWKFAAEKTEHILKCWVLQESTHDLILGSSFLGATQTLTRFVRRIKSKVVALLRRLRLQLLDNGKQRLCGFLNGNYTAAFPDTGSDVMLVSRKYAEKHGLRIDIDIIYEVELGDGTAAWTSGVVRDMEWKVGGLAIRRDFHVLDDLCVDVVLSNDYLFDFKIFSEYSEYLDDGIEKDLPQFCNIRLIGQYGESLNLLEGEYLNDVNAPDAFVPEKVQRELARRDFIRDAIAALPEDQQDAAHLSEIERQRRWKSLKKAHLSSIPQPPTSQQQKSASRSLGTLKGNKSIKDGKNAQARVGLRTWWTRRAG